MEQMFQKQYAVELRADGLFFVRFPSQEDSLPLGVDEILREARQLGISSDRETDLVKVFRDALGVEVLVCPQDEIETVDGLVEVAVAKDAMQATIKITPPRGYGKPIDAAIVDQAIKEKGVVFGLIAEEINSLAQNGYSQDPVVIALGEPAINGIDGKVEYLFAAGGKGQPKVLDDGSVDFHALNLIITVEKGSPLAEVIDPIPGTPGTNVLGVELKPKEGKPATAPVGKNVSFSPETRMLIAEITGEVVIEKSRISVLATHTETADIGPETGDIDFSGSVIVRGSVLSGYSVRASGTVDVHGQVIGGIIEAGGDVIARVGIQGQGHGYVKSGGNVMAKFIENARIMAAGDVDGGEAIIQSSVDSGGVVQVLNRKGVIVGGVIRAARMVSANVFGAEIGTLTEIEIGINPLFREEFKEIMMSLPEKEKDLEKVKKAVAMLKQMEKAANGVLPEDRRTMLVNLTKTQFQLIGEISTMQKRREVLEIELENAKQGKLSVRDYIYPGTRLLIGKARMHIQDTIQHATLALDNWEIRVGPY
jgi:hypothetical protein